MQNREKEMNFDRQFLFYAGMTAFFLWTAFVIFGLKNSFSHFDSPENFSRRSLSVVHDISDNLLIYVLTAIVPAFLLLRSIRSTQNSAAAGQIRVQIVFMTIIAAVAGVGSNAVILLNNNYLRQGDFPPGFGFLLLDTLIVAAPLVWLLFMLPAARISKSFLKLLPVIMVTSFLMKFVYMLSNIQLI